jgi:hypothetical protein
MPDPEPIYRLFRAIYLLTSLSEECLLEIISQIPSQSLPPLVAWAQSAPKLLGSFRLWRFQWPPEKLPMLKSYIQAVSSDQDQGPISDKEDAREDCFVYS